MTTAKNRKDVMVKAYLDGNTLKEAAVLIGATAGTCQRELTRRDIPRRECRQYKIDETFFDIIDNESKAYWLGMLSADGGISHKRVCLGFAARDEEHLIKFRTAIKSGQPIYETTIKKRGKEYPFVKLQINSVRLSRALQALGVVPRKSLILTPCQQIPKDLIRHYWRGIVEGDGCIASYKWKDQSRNVSQGYIGLTSSEGMVRSFDAWVKTFITTTAQPKQRCREKAFQVHYCGARITKAIAERLYSNAHIYLDRKYKLALVIMRAKIRLQDRSNITLADLNSAYAEHETWAAVARTMGIPENSIYGIHRRLLAQEQSSIAKGT